MSTCKIAFSTAFACLVYKNRNLTVGKLIWNTDLIITVDVLV